MPIRVDCDECGKHFNAPDAYAGKSVKCPNCQASLKIPLINARPRGNSAATQPSRIGILPIATAVCVGLAVGIAGGMGMSQWMSSAELDELRESTATTKEKLANSEKTVNELRGLLKGFEADEPEETIVNLDSGRSSPIVAANSRSAFLGVSRMKIVADLQKMYALRDVTETETKIQATLGQDNVIEVAGSPKNTRSVLVFGSLTDSNAMDMARVMYIAWESILPNDQWLREWLPTAIAKVDVGYTISASHSGLKIELGGIVFEETPLVLLSIKPSPSE